MNLYEKTETYRGLSAKLVHNHLPGCEHFQLKSDLYYECYARHLTLTLYHPSSTVSMGRKYNDSVAVVDSHLKWVTYNNLMFKYYCIIFKYVFVLRVLKTRGLRVADTSVLRKITNANLNAAG